MSNPAGWRDILEAAKQKDFEAVKWFVEEKGASIAKRNDKNQTVAHIAIENDQFFLFQYCVAKDKSLLKLRDDKLRSPLVRAVQKNAYSIVTHILEECNEDMQEKHNIFFGVTVLHLAAQEGHLELLKYFVEEQNCDSEIKTNHDETPLFFAAEHPHMHVVKYLIEDQQVDAYATDKDGQHVLYVSAFQGDLILPKYLLDKLSLEIDLNSKDNFGETLLHVAVKFGHKLFAKYLVEEKKVLVNTKNEEGKTPLHLAVAEKNLDLVEYLCKHGAFIDVRDNKNETTLDLAKDQRIRKYLEEVASKKRTRRSVSTKFDPRTMFSDPMCTNKISGENALSIGDGQAPFLRNELSSLVNGILILASLCLKYSTMSTYLEPKVSSHPPTSAEIIENRIDPVAVEASEIMFGFEIP